MKREREMNLKNLTSITGCNQPSKLPMKNLQCEEYEYNDNNLFFYCFYYDNKSKRINPLPKSCSKLINSSIKS